MQAGHLVAALIAGVLVSGGVWIGATVFGSGEDAPPAAPLDSDPDVAVAPPAPVPPPMLGTSDNDSLNRRMGALEQRLAKIEAAMASRAKELEPMMKLFEQAKASGMIGPDGAPAMGGIVPGDDANELHAHMGPGYARRLGDALGLDAAGKASLQKAVDEIFEKIKALEKEHAKVSTEGDTTTIRIGTYNGDVLKRDWEDWVARNLTSEQQAKVKDQHAANTLFGNRLGEYERAIEIEEAGGNINISETAKPANDDAGEVRTQMMGPALARDEMLAPYNHLLK